ncbi:DUF4349 domain-containing protein [Flavobacterium sp.]|uniref:DUF4349 domain-containing protein n=1 Tax=Flavobacterium sp. TaxID=239 RepID=UPI0035291062
MKKIGLIIMLFFMVSCQEKSESVFYEKSEATEAVSSFADMAVAEEPQNNISIDNANTQAKIIKTANLRFATTSLNESFASIQKVVNQYKASIQNDISGKDYNSIYRNITIRVPSQSFDSFIAEISKGVTYFDRKEIIAQDVTEEFVDVEARLLAKKTLENRYLELLKKATKITEILEIEKELSSIREEIEAQQGRLNYLQNRVSMSTVSIEMYTEVEHGTGTTVSYGTKMWNAIKSGFNGISNFFLGILYIWPFILILAILFFFLRRKWKKRKLKNEENL